MPSLIIPACNEAKVLHRCVSALLRGAERDEFEVVIVCNGCTDATAEVARRCHGDITVLETAIGSKTNALNLGDAVATRYPRFYIDADVVVTAQTLRALSDRLEKLTLAAAPRARFDLSECSWAVRAFYAINDRLPSSSEGIGGSGVYGVSKEGRERFGRFPDIIADDGFVRLQFAADERETPANYFSTVFGPHTLKQLIQIKTRSHLGTAQLKRLMPDRWQHRGPSNGTALLRLFMNPALWPMLIVYCSVKVIARLRARKKLRLQNWTWERDDSSRRRLAPDAAPVANFCTVPTP